MSTRTTLLDVFTPPEGLTGQTSILAAMSGTEGFLRAALNRFTGLGSARRAAAGCPFAYLFLDGHPNAKRRHTFGPHTVPGLYEFQPRAAARSSLLHAKLAFLSFGRGRHSSPQVLRLAVATANWTEHSARHRLELLWMIDVPVTADGLQGAPEDLSDLATAGVFLKLLAARYYVQVGNDRSLLSRRYHGLLALLPETDQKVPARRLLHSWDESLFEQIHRRLASEDGQRKNVVICGSGSFEEPPKEGQARKPQVLQRIEALASPNAHRVLVADPLNAGAVACWWKQASGSDRENWKWVWPRDPDAHNGRERALHAKFIYVGYLRSGSYSNGWLYLGSGNLSQPGLLRAVNQAGNIETGVILRVQQSMPDEALKAALFVSTERVGEEDLKEWVEPSEKDVEMDALVSVPPVLRAWADTSGPVPQLVPVWRDEVEPSLEAVLSWPDGSRRAEVRQGECLPVPDGRFPATVDVSVVGGDATIWTVPVETSQGLYCLPPAAVRAFDESMDALLEFPIEAEGEEAGEEAEVPEEDEAGDDQQGSPGAPQRATPVNPVQYPLYTAMDLLERLGAHQSGLPPELIDDWLHHLDVTLAACFVPEQLSAWRDLGIDFSKALRVEGFQPPGMTKAQARRYREIVERALQSWGVAA